MPALSGNFKNFHHPFADKTAEESLTVFEVANTKQKLETSKLVSVNIYLQHKLVVSVLAEENQPRQ